MSFYAQNYAIPLHVNNVTYFPSSLSSECLYVSPFEYFGTALTDQNCVHEQM
jgi:hypothetical protein